MHQWNVAELGPWFSFWRFYGKLQHRNKNWNRNFVEKIKRYVSAFLNFHFKVFNKLSKCMKPKKQHHAGTCFVGTKLSSRGQSFQPTAVTEKKNEEKTMMKRWHTFNEAANDRPIELAVNQTTKLFKFQERAKEQGGSYSLLLVACNWKNEMPPSWTAPVKRERARRFGSPLGSHWGLETQASISIVQRLKGQETRAFSYLSTLSAATLIIRFSNAVKMCLFQRSITLTCVAEPDISPCSTFRPLVCQ